MQWDVLLAVGIGLSQLVLAWYGVYVSVQENRIRNAVVIGTVGLVGIGLTVGVTVRNSIVQDRLQAQLDRIQHNTETPPQVSVNVPPPVIPPQNRHARVLFLNPAEVPQPSPSMTLPMKEGSNALNIVYQNVGDFPLQKCRYIGGIQIVSKSIDVGQMFNRFLHNNHASSCPDIMPRTGQVELHTYHSESLSAADAEDINLGQSKQICATARVTWNDESGYYRQDFCACWSGPMSNQTMFSSCSSHNDEAKLPGSQ